MGILSATAPNAKLISFRIYKIWLLVNRGVARDFFSGRASKNKGGAKMFSGPQHFKSPLPKKSLVKKTDWFKLHLALI